MSIYGQVRLARNSQLIWCQIGLFLVGYPVNVGEDPWDTNPSFDSLKIPFSTLHQNHGTEWKWYPVIRWIHTIVLHSSPYIALFWVISKVSTLNYVFIYLNIHFSLSRRYSNTHTKDLKTGWADEHSFYKNRKLNT